MGYLGGKGLPFFGKRFKGMDITEDNKKQSQSIAKNVSFIRACFLFSLKHDAYVELSFAARCHVIYSQSFNIHKQVGIYGKYLVPLHVAGALQHWARGHAVFSRINPFGDRPKF